MVNGAQTLVFGVIFDSQNNLPYFDTFNLVYYHLNFSHTAGQQYIIEPMFSYMYFTAYKICIDSAFSLSSTQRLSCFSCKIEYHGKKNNIQKEIDWYNFWIGLHQI